MGSLSPSHWLVVVIVGFALLLIFNGSRKIPELARGLGRGMRIFKSELNELKNDQHQPAAETPQLPVVEKQQEPINNTAIASDAVN